MRPAPKILLATALVLLPGTLFAHTGVHSTSSFADGLQHPLLGLDHLLAMIAVGLWAVQRGGRALCAIPASFVGVMSFGGLLGATGIPFPLVEPGILGSVLLLGLLIAFAVKLPATASAALVGFFALFHGYAHATEMPANASGLLYALGFLLATAALHGAGIAFGKLLQGKAREIALRATGGLIAAWGTLLIIQTLLETTAA